MKEFCYTIKDPVGIHARPAGLLVKEAQKYQSDITLTAKGQQVSAKKLFALMSLAVKQGDQVCLKVSGEDESAAAEGLERFFGEHL